MTDADIPGAAHGPSARASRLWRGRAAAVLPPAVLLAVLLAAGFAATAGGGPSGPSSPAGAASGEVPGAGADGEVVGVPTPLRHVPPEIAAVADGKLLVYRMPGLTGRRINATAMLFVPKGRPPAAGRPLFVWGHGTVGWAPECAPSVQLQRYGRWADGPNAELLAAVLRTGVAVVAPDYEGMGPAAAGVTPGHGYYDLPSEGRSMVYSAVAAKRALGRGLSGQWAPGGWSEGGFAALAAAHYSGLAAEADARMVYRGTVSLAPVPDVPAMNKLLWQDIDSASRSGLPPSDHQIDQLVFANAETIYFTRTERYAGYAVDPARIYRSRMLAFYRDNWRTCLDDLNALVKQDIQQYLNDSPAHTLASYPGIRGDGADTLPENRRFHRDNQGRLENARLPGSVLWLFGTDDITSPDAVTYDTVDKMLINGNDINLAVLRGAGHYDVPTVGRPLVLARLRQLFPAGS